MKAFQVLRETVKLLLLGFQREMIVSQEDSPWEWNQQKQERDGLKGKKEGGEEHEEERKSGGRKRREKRKEKKEENKEQRHGKMETSFLNMSSLKNEKLSKTFNI